MKRETIRLGAWVAIVIIWLLIGWSLMGCTVVTYCPPGQACISVADFHPAGGDVELFIRRSDGTVVWAARGQPSSEAIITGVVNALNPTGALLP